MITSNSFKNRSRREGVEEKKNLLDKTSVQNNPGESSKSYSMPTSSGITCQCQGDPTLLPNTGDVMGAAGRLQGHSRTQLTHPGKVALLSSAQKWYQLCSLQLYHCGFLKCQKLYPGTSLGGPVVETPHFQCRGLKFNPWSENYDPSWFSVAQKIFFNFKKLYPNILFF